MEGKEINESIMQSVKLESDVNSKLKSDLTPGVETLMRKDALVRGSKTSQSLQLQGWEKEGKEPCQFYALQTNKKNANFFSLLHIIFNILQNY